MNKEISSLTGLRGIAAIWVLTFHAGALVGNAPGWLQSAVHTVGRAGYLGVDIFFVLSGFVLAHNYANVHGSTTAYRAFLWKRLARIYPVHLATLALIAAIALAFAGADIPFWPELFTLDGFAKSVLMVHAWVPYTERTWNLYSWSISCEWAAYLVFPLLMSRISRTSRKTWLMALLVLLFAGLHIATTMSHYFAEAMNAAIYRIAAEFTAGIAVYRLMTLAGPIRYGDAIGSAAMFAMIVGGAVLDRTYRLAALDYLPILSVMVVYGIASSTGAVSRLLSHPGLQYLGVLSYSLYMVHGIVFLTARASMAAFPDHAGSIAIVAVPLAFVLAQALYRWVEVPCRAWMLRDRGMGDRTTTSTSAAAV